jgi:hypothetical protein
MVIRAESSLITAPIDLAFGTPDGSSMCRLSSDLKKFVRLPTRNSMQPAGPRLQLPRSFHVAFASCVEGCRYIPELASGKY